MLWNNNRGLFFTSPLSAWLEFYFEKFAEAWNDNVGICSDTQMYANIFLIIYDECSKHILPTTLIKFTEIAREILGSIEICLFTDILAWGRTIKFSANAKNYVYLGFFSFISLSFYAQKHWQHCSNVYGINID